MSEIDQGLGPCAAYKHEHPPVQNVNVQHEKAMSLGQRVADRVAAAVGSWPFIIIQSILLTLWMAVNAYLVIMTATHPGFLKAWDPYPFILLNLVLSFQAAYTGPVVMMSQNRQSEKDRLAAEQDYVINQKAEEEIQVVMNHLAHQDTLILDAIQRLEALQVTPPVQQLAAQIEGILARMEVQDRRLLALLEKMEKASPPVSSG
jgi:uncharacterized membrane protein